MQEKKYTIEDLDFKLGKVIKNEINNHKFQREVNKSFASKGLMQRVVKCLFSNTKLPQDLNTMEKMTFTNACYEYFNDVQFKIDRYYSCQQIAEWSAYMNTQEVIDDITLEDFRMINGFEYHGDISFEQIYKYMQNVLLIYYPSTQRSAKYKRRSDVYVREININQSAVNEICNLILEDRFEATEIILNCMAFKGKVPKFTFEKKYKNIGDITIKPNYDINSKHYTVCTILDGYHRILGICAAVQKHLDATGEWLEGYISCKLVLADLNRAKHIVTSVFKRTDDDKNWLKALERNDYSIFADMLTNNSRILRNNVAEVYEQCIKEKKLTYKLLIMDLAKVLGLNVNNNTEMLFVTEEVNERFDLMFTITKENLEELDNVLIDVLLTPNFYAIYMIIAYRLKDTPISASKYHNMLVKLDRVIDEEKIRELGVYNKKVKLAELVKYCDELLNEVI